jgi:hypothetical protein
MADYRITIRYGSGAARYEILDLSAPDLRAALTEAAGRINDEVAATADLAEIRVQMSPDDRQYAVE